jgi:hypothetical protein
VGVTVLYPGPLNTSLVRDGLSDSGQRRKQEEQFLETRGVPMDRVVQRCLDRLLGDPARIVIGLDYHLLDMLARLSPRIAGPVVAFAARRTGF